MAFGSCHTHVIRRDFQRFFHKKDMDQTQTINRFFSYSDLGLSIKNLDQNYDTPSNHQQSFCEIETFDVSPLERYRPDTAFFHSVTLNLPK